MKASRQVRLENPSPSPSARLGLPGARRPRPLNCALPATLSACLGLGLSCASDEADPPPASLAGSGGGEVAAGSGGAGGGETVDPGGEVSIPEGPWNCGAAVGSDIPELTLTQIATGLTSPVGLVQPPGESSRLFVVEKPGVIRIIDGGQLLPTPFLDIRDAVSENFSEMGLLGLAFHPSYQQNGLFYVYHSSNAPEDNGFPPHTSQISEYRVSDADPDRADPASVRLLLSFQESEANHNGGDLHFGYDGFLYVSSGDGGGAGDQHGAEGNGQNLNTLLGKMLRIDVDGRDAGGYSIPPGNLAAINPNAADARPEIWSYGLRNPWRFSFDRCTAEMYIADVGQDTLEEVNVEPPQSGGRNYGWRLMEAERCFNPASGCDAAAQNLVLPTVSYGRREGVSITGGFVYRGSAIPALRGTYLYADYQTNNFFAFRMTDGALSQGHQDITNNVNPGDAVREVSSFGQDNAGEVYVVSLTGSVYRVDPE